MKIKDYKCNCGHNDFFFADKGNQKGIYCSYCGKWLKWADKNEQNLAMKQESILDEIKAEIDSAKLPKNRMSFFRDGINCALEIIDKYKAESELRK